MRDSNLLSAFYGQPWAMTMSKLYALQDILERHASGERLSEAEIAERIGATREASNPSAALARSGAPRNGKVAIIPVTGVIAQHARMVNQVSTSSGSSCEAIGNMLDAAMADPDCTAIVFDVDSPGGSVFGVQELAGKIMSARGKKPMIAVANSQMASAAYWIGCAADELWVTPSGEVGSIGVFCVHQDASEMFAKEGIKHTIIKAGDNKAEGNPYEPLSKDALAYAQSQIDDYYAAFVKGVAQARGVTIATVEADFGQGRTATAQVAVRRGMADKVGTLDQALARFGVSASSKRAPLASNRAAEDDGMGIAAGGLTLRRIDDAAVPLRLGEAFTGLLAQGKIEALTPEFVAADGALAPSPSAENDITYRPHVAKEQTVDNTAAPTGATAVDINAAIAADRVRAKEIRSLCDEHKVADANFAQALIDRGLSVPEASLEILRAKRATQAATPVVVTGVTDRAGEAPFASLGDQLLAIVKAERTGRQVVDPRLMRINAAASGMSEGVPSDGGFALQPEFSSEILNRAYTDGEVLSRVNRKPIGENSNGLKINAVDESSRATGSRFGGIQMYWANEADAATASKPKLRQMDLVLHKLIGLWYLTDELAQDTTALSGIASDAFSQEVTFMVEDAILNGTGVGQPLGIFNTSALVVVPKESGQLTGTLSVANLAKMFGRMWARSQKNGVWFINQDVYQQLFQLVLGNFPVYMPPSGVAGAPYGTIYGRPVVPIEQAASLSTQGDINFLDLSQYLLIDKGGAQTAQSVHVRFLNDETAFRIVYRVDGQPIWNKVLTPKNGANTVSPFISLQAR